MTARTGRSRTAGALTLVAAVLASLAAAVLMTARAEPASALTGSQFHAGNIISDAQFYDSTAMSAAQVQTFLDSQVPACQAGYTCLPQYTTKTTSQAAQPGLCDAYTGQASETAAQIIANVAKACSINPQVLIVLLQKEQGLVTSTSPSSYNYNYATGANCPDTTGCSANSAGFFKQVYLAAYQFQYYRAHPDYYNYLAGRNNYILYNPNTKCRGSQVFIENEATASLYIYTPYQPNAAALANLTGTGDKCSAYGNRNFWYFFNTWFAASPTPHSAGGLVLTRRDGSLWYYADSGSTTQPYTNGVRIGISGWGKILSLAAGDVNGDGLGDLIGTRSDGSLWLYANDGSSLPFGHRQQIGSSGWTAFSTIMLGDVNGDGLADLVATTPDGRLWLYLNGGNAAHPFGPRSVIGWSGWQGFSRLMLGDVDGDGRADLTAVKPDGSLWLFRNGGDAARPFSASVRIGSSGWQHLDKMVVTDVDSDGLADLVASKPNGDLWLYPNAAGRAQPFPRHIVVGHGGWDGFDRMVATGVPVVHRDEPADLVATQPSGTLWRYTEADPRPFPSASTLSSGWRIYRQILLADLDGDGKADIVGIKPDGSLWWYRNTGSATWPYTAANLRKIGASGWQRLTQVMSADVDGDGTDDLVATRSDGSLWLYPGTGSSTSPLGRRREIGASGWGQFDRIAAADVNGDGRADLIATRPDGSLVRYLNTGNAARPFGPAQASGLSGWQDYTRLAAGDVDGDARADLVAVGRDGSLQLDRDAGSDRFPDTTLIGAYGWQAFDTVLAGDVNGDGLADLIVRNSSGRLLYYRNSGAADRFYAAGDQIGASGWDGMAPMALGDVDGDGRPDLVAVRSDGTLWLYRNLGDVTRPYTPAGRAQIGASGWTNYDTLVAADIDGDGRADLIGRKPDGSLWLYRNTGNPARPYTGTKTQIGTGWGQYDTTLAADVNGDGLADLIARRPDGTLWLYANAHDPGDPFPTATQIGSGWQALGAMAAGDVDHDGRADIVAAKPDGTLWLFRNVGGSGSPYPAGARIGASGWTDYDRLLL